MIVWRLHLRSSSSRVYEFLSTNDGRARFWAESAVETSGSVHFLFQNGQSWMGRMLRREPPHRFDVEYFGGSTASFELRDDGQGGTDLTLTETDVPAHEIDENRAGWVAVLLALKAAADHGVDLRNHDPGRTWEQRYVDA